MEQYEEDDPNRPETEEDGLRAGALRRLKVCHQFRLLTGRDHNLLSLPTDTKEKTESPTIGKDDELK